MESNIESQALKEFKEKWVGKSVVVVDPKHPHYKEVGEVLDVKNTFAGMGMEIEGEWESFFVFHGSQIKVI